MKLSFIKHILSFLLFFACLFSSCEKEEDEPMDLNLTNSPQDTTRTIEQRFNISKPYFYTGLFNGRRVTYETDGNSFPEFFSQHWNSSQGGSRGITTGFFSLLTIDIYHEYGHYGVPDTSSFFYIGKYYTNSNGSNIPNDTLRYTLHYDNQIESYRSDQMLNLQAKFKVVQFLPHVNRSFIQRDIRKRFRAEIDSLWLPGLDSILITDFVIQSPIE